MPKFVPLLLLKETRKPLLLAIAAICAMSVTGCASQAITPTAITTSGTSATAATAATATTTATDTSAQVVKPTGFDKFLGIISPYRISIQQGNFVSQEMASQLKEGMTREQVRFLLGTAMLTDMFHEDRWDYPFRLLKPNGELITSRLAVFFKNNTVQRFEGGNLPTEKEYLANITTSAIAARNETPLDVDIQQKKKKGE